MTRRSKAPTLLEDLASRRDILDHVSAEGARKIRVRTKYGTEEITKLNALIRKTVDDALTGGPHSVRIAINLLAEAETLQRLEREEACKAWERIKAHHEQQLREAERAGANTDHILPHPDDIILRPGEAPEIIGPINAAELAEANEHMLYREAYLLEDALWRARDKRRADYTFDTCGPAMLALMINKKLPKRFQWDENTFLRHREGPLRHSERELSKMRRRAWDRLGHKVERNARPFPRKQTGQFMTAIAEVMGALMHEDLSDDETTQRLAVALRRQGVKIKGDP